MPSTIHIAKFTTGAAATFAVTNAHSCSRFSWSLYFWRWLATFSRVRPSTFMFCAFKSRKFSRDFRSGLQGGLRGAAHAASGAHTHACADWMHRTHQGVWNPNAEARTVMIAFGTAVCMPSSVTEPTKRLWRSDVQATRGFLVMATPGSGRGSRRGGALATPPAARPRSAMGAAMCRGGAMPATGSMPCGALLGGSGGRPAAEPSDCAS